MLSKKSALYARNYDAILGFLAASLKDAIVAVPMFALEIPARLHWIQELKKIHSSFQGHFLVGGFKYLLNFHVHCPILASYTTDHQPAYFWLISPFGCWMLVISPSIYLSICLSVCLSIYLSIYLPNQSINESINQSMNQSLSLSLYIYIYVYIYTNDLKRSPIGFWNHEPQRYPHW